MVWSCGKCDIEGDCDDLRVGDMMGDVWSDEFNADEGALIGG